MTEENCDDAEQLSKDETRTEYAPPNGTAPLEFDDVVAYLDNAKAELGCPACGGYEWDLSDSYKSAAGAQVPTLICIPPGGNIGKSAKNVPVILAICKQCSFIRMHARKPIVRWIDSRAREADANE